MYTEEFANRLKEHAGEQWEPSNGTEGELFIAAWCCNCAMDKAMREGADFDECDDDEKCEIIGASFRGEAAEWQYDRNGQPCCTAFVPAGETIPAPRCTQTADMFEVPNAEVSSRTQRTEREE